MEQLRQDENLRWLLETLDRPSKPYYVFDENEIRLLPNQSFLPTANAIIKLRTASTAQHYNKIGGKADDFLYKYLFKYPDQDTPPEE